MTFVKIKSIKKLSNKQQVYDIVGVNKNNNYIGNNLVLHNSSEDWAKATNKDLKKKLGQVRTKHLLYILCFPLKIYKVEKTYLENYVNYWIDIVFRGLGVIYVKDRNPSKDPWRISDFKLIGSYTEFTNINKVKEQVKKHPNFWQVIKFPRPPEWLYNRYLKVRESNVYDDANVLANVTKQDIYNALLTLTLRDIMLNDSTLTMNRILLHIKNEYDMTLTKSQLNIAIDDAKQLITKVKEQFLNINDIDVKIEQNLPVKEEDLGEIENIEETTQTTLDKDLI